MIDNSVKKLVEELTLASEIYYSGLEEPIMSDHDFDIKVEKLEDYYNELSKEDKQSFMQIPGAYKLISGVNSDSEAGSVLHFLKMLSLEKAKTEPDLDKFLEKLEKEGCKTFNLQAKMDGMAICARYNNGKLTLVGTRGDGHSGEDITKISKDSFATIEGLPLTVKSKESFEVRGELLMSKDSFININKIRASKGLQEFTNPRNATAGLVRKSVMLGSAHSFKLLFVVYSLIKNNAMSNEPLESFSEDFIEATYFTSNNTGLSTSKIPLERVKQVVKDFGELRESFPVPVDGIVIKPYETALFYSKMGENSHHPLSQIAWKYPTEKVVSKIIEVEATVGKVGRITPRAKIEPVIIDGSLISYASLHNYENVINMGIRIGSEVLVEKAGEIIPQIVSVINAGSGKEILPPTKCPSCGEKLKKYNEVDYKNLMCVSPNCKDKKIRMLNSAVSTGALDIKSLGLAGVTALYEAGKIKNPTDILFLEKSDFDGLRFGKDTSTERKVGDSIADKILEEVENSKSLPYHRYLASLGIPSLGIQTSKDLMKKFRSLKDLLSTDVETLSQIEGIREVKAESIHKGILENSESIKKVIEAGFFVPERKGSLFEGTSFSISGTVPEPFKSRAELVSYLEENGGAFHATPNKNTSYVIGDTESSSSKIKKAKSLGCSIISPQDFSRDFYRG